MEGGGWSVSAPWYLPRTHWAWNRRSKRPRKTFREIWAALAFYMMWLHTVWMLDAAVTSRYECAFDTGKKVRIFDEFKAPFPPFFSLKTGEMFNVSGAVLLMGMFYLRRKWSIGFAGNCSHPLGSAGISLYAQGQLGGDVTEFGVTLRGWTKSKLMIFYILCLFRRV